MTVSGTEWRDAVEAGRFEEAQRLMLLTEEPGAELRRAVATLVDVQESVREKSWQRAKRRLERLEEKPPLVDWEDLREELEWLEGVSEQLDRSEPEQALELLDSRSWSWFGAEVANQRGTAQVYSGDMELARSRFQQAIDLDPRHFRALTNLGNAWLEEGEVDQAIDCYKRAIEINDEFPNAHHNLGVAYRRKGQIGPSVRELRRAQRVQQRVERDRARERLSGNSQQGNKMIRWAVYGLLALALFVILRNQGYI